MLDDLDETLWHQLPTTIDHLGTSDPRFFDRFWYAIYEPRGRGALQFTMGSYGNMNVLDAAIVVIVDGVQHNVRASRSLRPRLEMVCGPLRIQVLEPHRRHRLVIESGEHNISGELIFESTSAPEEEPQHYSRRRGRVHEDYARYDQVGVCSGRLLVGEQVVEIFEWWAARDHSWGIRPGVGVPEPVTGADDVQVVVAVGESDQTVPVHAWGQVRAEDRFLNLLIFLTTDSFAGHVLIFYRDDEMVRLDVTLHERGSGRVLHATHAELSIKLFPGTQRFCSFDLRLVLENTEEVTLAATAIGPSIAMAGLGYSGGYKDGRGLGAWRGDDHLEWDAWDVSDPEVVVDADGRRTRPLHRLQPVHLDVFSPSGPVGGGTGSTTMVYHGAPPAGMEDGDG